MRQGALGEVKNPTKKGPAAGAAMELVPSASEANSRTDPRRGHTEYEQETASVFHTRKPKFHRNDGESENATPWQSVISKKLSALPAAPRENDLPSKSRRSGESGEERALFGL